MTFEITAREDGTEVRFAHRGLVPEFECFESCSSGWGFFVNRSLRHLITTGEGPASRRGRDWSSALDTRRVWRTDN